MKSCAFLQVVLTALVLGPATPSRGDDTQPASSASLAVPASVLTNVAAIEMALSTNTPETTVRLAETLEALRSKDLPYLCGLARPTQEEILSGPPRAADFEKIVQELGKRGGARVRQAFERVLIDDKLLPYDKSTVRDCFRREMGEDPPITLPASDRSQRHEYLLRFDPENNWFVTVQKGETLLKIARREYPLLSQWSAGEVLFYMNGLEDRDVIHAGQKLKIYPYEIVKDVQGAK